MLCYFSISQENLPTRWLASCQHDMSICLAWSGCSSLITCWLDIPVSSQCISMLTVNTLFGRSANMTIEISIKVYHNCNHKTWSQKFLTTYNTLKLCAIISTKHVYDKIFYIKPTIYWIWVESYVHTFIFPLCM